MAITYKTLGQVLSTANTLVDLYTVPTATNAVASTLTVCNQGVSTNFRIAIRPLGAPIEAKHYIIYDNFVNANDSIFLTIGIALQATSVVSVQAGTATVSFTLSGSEIT